jgi:hypothetical protein
LKHYEIEKLTITKLIPEYSKAFDATMHKNEGDFDTFKIISVHKEAIAGWTTILSIIINK